MAREWWYNPGDNWLLDDLSGFKIRRTRSSVIPGGQTGGLAVSPDRWEPQQPQDFVRGVVDDQNAPLLRTRQQNRFVVVGTAVTAPSPAQSDTITVYDPAFFMPGFVIQIMLDTGDNFRTGLLSITGDVFTLASRLPGSVGGTYGDPLENSVLAIDTTGKAVFQLGVPGYDILDFNVLG